jgi:hypothetical protein
MFDHERFRELCALAAVGQLSPDEHTELDAHLSECPECRRLQEDYSRIIFDGLQRAEAIRLPGGATVSGFSSNEESLDRFLTVARAQGIRFSKDVGLSRVLPTSTSQPTWQWKLAVAIAILTLITIAGISLGHILHNPFPRNPFLGTPPSSIQFTK